MKKMLIDRRGRWGLQKVLHDRETTIDRSGIIFNQQQVNLSRSLTDVTLLPALGCGEEKEKEIKLGEDGRENLKHSQAAHGCWSWLALTVFSE